MTPASFRGKAFGHTFASCRSNRHVRTLLKLAAAVMLASACLASGGQDSAPPLPSAAATSTNDFAEARLRGEALKKLLARIPCKEPQAALAELEVIDGFAVELAAHEPSVLDPVAGAIDENGLLYIAEDADYPYRPAKRRKAVCESSRTITAMAFTRRAISSRKVCFGRPALLHGKGVSSSPRLRIFGISKIPIEILRPTS